MNTPVKPRIISLAAYQSILPYDPLYAAAAKVAVEMGYWRIDANSPNANTTGCLK